MNSEAIKTDQINLWPQKKRESLKKELVKLYCEAFPKMPEEQRDISVEDYYKVPGKDLLREVFLFRNETEKLVASAVFDRGAVYFGETEMEGIYSISRAILPQNQGFGLGKTIAKKIFTDYDPDILFATCAQSASLYSWIGLSQKGIIKGYKVYPRLDEKDGRQRLITFPLKDMDFAISIFKQVYKGVSEGTQETIDASIRNLTIHMVRKNIYSNLYGYYPWGRNERKDKIAEVLGLTQNDGVLVILRKEPMGMSRNYES